MSENKLDQEAAAKELLDAVRRRREGKVKLLSPRETVRARALLLNKIRD